MKVVYSINAKFGGPGVGNTAYHAVSGIYRADSLERLFVSSNTQHRVPLSKIRQWGILGRGIKYLSAKEPSGLLDHLGNVLFDAWVAAQLDRGDVFHGWNGLSLRSLRAAKRRGMVTVVERASAHPATYVKLLREEYARWGIPFRFPMWNYQRMLDEFERCDHITVPSKFALDSMVAHGVPGHKLIEIPFGVDLVRFSPKPSSHPFRVIFVGRISIAKGVPYLLEAWRQLHWGETELWLVGNITADFAAIHDRWAALSGVRFIDHTDSIAGLYRQCDLLAFPSIQEGSALVTYEAMACGLPVITTPNAGSIVRDGQEGFIVPIRDVDALYDRMERMRDDTLRKRMGQQARLRVEEFSWDRYGDRLVEAYPRIVE
jgi:glycosyltransferase involved in cell wall biosynthesis